MDNSIDDYDDEDGQRGASRGYRDQELRQDLRQQLPINRHGQISSVSQPYPEPLYSTAFQVVPGSSAPFNPAIAANAANVPRDPRSMVPNTITGSSQPPFPGDYTVTAGAAYSIPASVAPGGAARYADTANNRIMYQGGLPYPERHAPPRR
jgi:hypothetical protein